MDQASFLTLYDNLYRWLDTNLLAWHAGIQLLAISLGICVSHYLARVGGRYCKENASLSKITILTWDSLFLVLLSLFGWLMVAIADEKHVPYGLLETFASIATAGALAHVVSCAVNHTLVRLFVPLIWLAATLQIAGWLDPTISALRKISFSFGAVTISLLSLIEGMLCFIFLLWMAKFLSRLLGNYINRSQEMTPSQKVLFCKLQNILLIGLAFLITLHVVGINLTAFAVFGGALGLGIGFGLQKVISNLVSGIILLADKSIKPGDVIEIGDKYGWVNALSARYVSVLTRDGKEHLIPNENLITEYVVNWSHSSNNVRVHIPIGVSYNADIHQVAELLVEAGLEHPRSLKNMPPVCLLQGFGASSVNFELCVWINDAVNGIETLQSDLLFAIWDKFKAHHIELPFQQLDIHIKSGEKGVVSQ